MRVLLQGEEIEEGEIVLDEIYVKLIGHKDEEAQINEDTLKKMLVRMKSNL